MRLYITLYYGVFSRLVKTVTCVTIEGIEGAPELDHRWYYDASVVCFAPWQKGCIVALLFALMLPIAVGLRMQFVMSERRTAPLNLFEQSCAHHRRIGGIIVMDVRTPAKLARTFLDAHYHVLNTQFVAAASKANLVPRKTVKSCITKLPAIGNRSTQQLLTQLLDGCTGNSTSDPDVMFLDTMTTASVRLLQLNALQDAIFLRSCFSSTSYLHPLTPIFAVALQSVLPPLHQA
jgi:hypothetical protein